MELHLYDFDGTLFRSPDMPDWWEGPSWFVSSLSMGPPCVPEHPGPEWWIRPVVSEARGSISDPNVWAVLCTGRALRSGHRYRIPELLKQKGLHFDEVYLNPGQNTRSYKIKVLIRILQKLPEIGVVHIWEDHLENLGSFCRAVKSAGYLCIAHPVRVRAMEPTCTELDVLELETHGWRRVASRWMSSRVVDYSNPVHYIGAFLSPMSRQRLLRDFPPVHQNVLADHMTIILNPTEDEVNDLRIGRKVRLKVIGYAEDNKAQAVLVHPKGTRSENKDPHITISTAGGTSPKYSKVLLSNQENVQRVVGPTLEAVLDTFPRRFSRHGRMVSWEDKTMRP